MGPGACVNVVCVCVCVCGGGGDVLVPLLGIEPWLSGRRR